MALQFFGEKTMPARTKKQRSLAMKASWSKRKAAPSPEPRYALNVTVNGHNGEFEFDIRGDGTLDQLLSTVTTVLHTTPAASSYVFSVVRK